MDQQSVIQQVKQIEIELLRDFIAVCEQLSLQYYVIGGTLLGAVRHKGFIPWDDDIDVGMPREDYEAFLKKAQMLLPEEDFVQTWKTDPDYPANFAKLRRSGTAFVEESLKNRMIHHGIYIDIFPLDNCPSPGMLRGTILLCNNALLQRISLAFYNPNRTIRSRIRQTVTCVFVPSRKMALSLREALHKAYQKTGWIANYCGAWGKREIMPSNWYGSGKVLEFEGMKVIAPVAFEDWLTKVYGNYLELPPKEKQYRHHHTSLIDISHPANAISAMTSRR